MPSHTLFGRLGLLAGLAGATGAAAAGTLHGTRPDQALSAPSFELLNHLGQPRSAADLQGRPTVLWFFPMAGTPG